MAKIEPIERLKEILGKLKSIGDFETKDEEFLISSHIMVCEGMIEDGIVPSGEFFNIMDLILNLHKELDNGKDGN